MRITLYTDYALRVLIYLALRRDERCTIAEIAEAYGISHNHLAKVVADLQQQGHVDALRGRNGGLRLARAPEDIRLGDVVRASEPELATAECSRTGNACTITPHCHLRFVLDDALSAFLAVLDRYTLADLLGRRRSTGLRRALRIVSV